MLPKTVAIIGGGPAGLMAAEILSGTGIKVDLYEAMPSVGRKFLMAGKGGMNITHSEPYEKFITRYGVRSGQLKPILDQFTPQILRDWVKELGFETFIGSSGRVFPSDMKAAPLLRTWLHRLRVAGVSFHMRHRWLGWIQDDDTTLAFSTQNGECKVKADAVILALGGGSWPQLGSNGAWVRLLVQKGVRVASLKPANCGFTVNWSEHFRKRFSGEPLKSVRISFCNSEGGNISQQGEMVITANGLEGGLIYSLSGLLRDEIAISGFAQIYLDLLPDKEMPAIIDKLSYPRGKQSLANHLRKRLGLEGVKAGLLREILASPVPDNPELLSSAIKALPVKLIAVRPIEEAISSAGGVEFETLDEHLMIQAMPGVFCAGEMLDWEAPTGGYLLTACLATGRAAGLGALAYLSNISDSGTLTKISKSSSMYC